MRKVPKLYNLLGPIFAPYAPNMGDEANAAKLNIPNTNPYYIGNKKLLKMIFHQIRISKNFIENLKTTSLTCDGVAPFFSASDG